MIEALTLSACHTCSVRHRALCGALSTDELQQLNAISFRRTYGRHEPIMDDRQESEFFANILSGVVKLQKLTADGRQQIVGLQFASDFIGRPFSARIPFFVETATAVELCCFRVRDFEALVRATPGLEHRMFQQTLDDLDAAREWMVLLGRKSAEERVLSLLILMTDRMVRVGCEKSGGSLTYTLPLTRAEMADFLGLTIETVSRQLSRLKSRGLIELPNVKSLVVPCVATLSAELGDGA